LSDLMTSVVKTNEAVITEKASIGGEDLMTVNGATITAGLQIHQQDGVTTSELELHKHGDTATRGALAYGARSRGTDASPTVVQSGDTLLEFIAVGYDGTDYGTSARIQMAVDGTPGNNDMPGRIVFYTAADGSQTLTERLRIDNAGQLLPANIHNNGGTGNASNQAIASGTWTPTLTGINNIDSLTALSAFWMRVGNCVQCACQVTTNATSSATETRFSLTLPVASDLASTTSLTGSGTLGGGAGSAPTTFLTVYGNLTTDRAEVAFTSQSTGDSTARFTFMYEVV